MGWIYPRTTWHAGDVKMMNDDTSMDRLLLRLGLVRARRYRAVIDQCWRAHAALQRAHDDLAELDELLDDYAADD